MVKTTLPRSVFLLLFGLSTCNEDWGPASSSMTETSTATGATNETTSSSTGIPQGTASTGNDGSTSGITSESTGESTESHTNASTHNTTSTTSAATTNTGSSTTSSDDSGSTSSSGSTMTGDSTNSSSDPTDGDTNCPAGTLGCSCEPGRICEADLVCNANNICEIAPAPTTSSTSDGGDESTSDSSSDDDSSSTDGDEPIDRRLDMTHYKVVCDVDGETFLCPLMREKGKLWEKQYCGVPQSEHYGFRWGVTQDLQTRLHVADPDANSMCPGRFEWLSLNGRNEAFGQRFAIDSVPLSRLVAKNNLRWSMFDEVSFECQDQMICDTLSEKVEEASGNQRIRLHLRHGMSSDMPMILESFE